MKEVRYVFSFSSGSVYFPRRYKRYCLIAHAGVIISIIRAELSKDKRWRMQMLYQIENLIKVIINLNLRELKLQMSVHTN